MTDDSFGLAHRGDPATSHNAVPTAADRARLKKALLELLERGDMTTSHLTTLYFTVASIHGWPIVKSDSVAKRLSELVNAGQVSASGRTELGDYGKQVTVWSVR